MNSEVPYKAVGLFVISLTIMTIVIIIWLSSGLTFNTYKKYTVLMKESVSGLNIDSPVELNGVNVGSVKSIKLNPSNPHLVDLTLSIKLDTPITQGSVATLASRGLTGLMYIALKDDSENLQPLLKKPGELYPVIRTAPSLFARVDTTLTKLSESFQVISTSLSKLLNENNQRAINNILLNTELAMNNLALASKNLPSLSHSAEQSLSGIQSNLIPQSNLVLSQLNQLSRNVNELTGMLKQNPSILIRGQTASPPGPGE